jgi:hypothetical protein
VERAESEAAAKPAATVSKSKRKLPTKRGSRKGVPNKSTADVRAAIAQLAEKNVHKLEGWLTRIGRTDPGRAADIFLRMLEYHIPKLTRTEIVKPPSNSGRVIDSSQLTAEQREQLRQMILGQAEPALLEQQQPNMLEPVGLGDAQVVERAEVDGSTHALDE